MTPRRALPALLCTALLASPLPTGTLPAAQAHEYERGSLKVHHPWARPTPPGVTVGAAYLTIQNRGARADTLTAFSTPAAARVELHETRMEGDMMRMRPIARLDIPARGSVAAEPGGLHLMLIDLKQPLVLGQRIPLRLRFARAGVIDTEIVVETPAEGPTSGQAHH